MELQDTHILIVEDQASIRSLLQLNLELEGYRVDALESPINIEQYLHKNKYNLAIFDVMLPHKSGVELCRIVRNQFPLLPIILISAKGLKQDVLLGLKAGADDYLIKPFDLDELLLKVHNNIQKFRQLEALKNPLESFKIGTCSVDLAAYKITNSKGISIELNAKEQAILKVLKEHQNKVVSRNELLDLIWGEDTDVSARTVDNFMVSLRKKIQDDPKEPQHLVSVRGVGYKLVSLNS